MTKLKKQVTRKKTKPKTSLLKLKPPQKIMGLFILCLVVLSAGLFAFTQIAQVNAQAAVAVRTFQSTYSGFNPSSSASLPNSQRCTTSEPVYGATPVAPGKYPLLVYIHGSYADLNKNTEGQRIVQLAAAQGFTAVALTYNSSSTNTLAGYASHGYCMFDQSHTGSGLTVACNVANADCSKGALLAGFSQGAAISVIAKNYTPNINAVWAIGLSATIYPSYVVPTNAIVAPGGTRALPNNKLVINMGQTSNIFTKDLNTADIPSMQTLTGAMCGVAFNCLQPDGSGYYVVQNSEVADKTADHCYWEGTSGCTLSINQLDPGFQPPATTKWSMIRNLDWLRSELSQ